MSKKKKKAPAFSYIQLVRKALSNPRWGLKFIYQYLRIKKSGLFDGVYYQSQFKKSVRIKRALLHYIFFSYETHASPCPLFDYEYYILQKPYIKTILQGFEISALYHYLKFGMQEGLNPNPKFDTKYYLSTNPDIHRSGLHPLFHYIHFGKSEGRKGSPEFEEDKNEIRTDRTNSEVVIQKRENKLPDSKILNYLNLDQNTANYKDWFKTHSPNQKDLRFQENHSFRYNPAISIIVPVYKPSMKFFREMINSVRAQSYQNWELCLSDSSNNPKLRQYIEKMIGKDKRIKAVFHDSQKCISSNSNAAADITSGEFIGFLDHDDILTPNALFEMVNYLNLDKQSDILYSDEDKISEDSKSLFDPFFKPDWSPDTFMSIMYTNHFTLVRTSLFNNSERFRIGYSGAQDYDLLLRLTEKTNKIVHIPQVLYHWRVHSESIASGIGAKDYAVEALVMAKKDALERRNTPGTLRESQLFPGQYCVDYKIKGNPKVSIIIPTRDQKIILENCINSIIKTTRYSNYEIIIVDNQSKEKETHEYFSYVQNLDNIKIIPYNNEFNFSAINNQAVRESSGDYLLFLNNDIEITQDNWLEKMMGFAGLNHVGAVGAQLIFPETETIQHCGVINQYNGPGHPFYNFPSNKIYHYGRNEVDYNWIAVTGACLLIEKHKFIEIGGFDEKLPIAYNDIDLCFKLIEKRYFNVCCNSVKLIHHESVSRGVDHLNNEKQQRLERDRNRLYRNNPVFFQHDPFYNPNLTHVFGDFRLEEKA